MAGWPNEGIQKWKRWSNCDYCGHGVWVPKSIVDKMRADLVKWDDPKFRRHYNEWSEKNCMVLKSMLEGPI